MNTKNNIQIPEFCSQCPNHCPADDLHCGRGRAYFANLRGEASEMPYRHEGHRPRDFEGHHGPHGPRGLHGPEGEHHHPKIDENASLETLLRACGHRLHHGMPGGPHGSQEMLLKMLKERDGRADQRALQELMRIRPASASELLTKLEDKGLIERHRDEEDRRRAQIILTEAGAAKAEAEEAPQEKKDLFEALSEEEQETLKQLLLKVLESWK